MYIGLIGYGGLGRQIKSMFESQYGLEVKFRYFDDEASAFNMEDAVPFNYWHSNADEDISYIVSLGYKHLDVKCRILRQLLELAFPLATYIHPTAHVNPAAVINSGTVVYPMSNVDTGVVLGSGVLLNNSVVVSHDSYIGDGCFLAPGVIISGNVKVGEGTFIGSGTTVSNGVTIGKNVVIGVGSCITHNIDDGSYVIGNPMRNIGRGLSLK